MFMTNEIREYKNYLINEYTEKGIHGSDYDEVNEDNFNDSINDFFNTITIYEADNKTIFHKYPEAIIKLGLMSIKSNELNINDYVEEIYKFIHLSFDFMLEVYYSEFYSVFKNN